MVNKVSNQLDQNLDATTSPNGNFLQNLSGNQCQQLISLLLAHLTSVTHTPENATNSFSSYSTGTCFYVSMK